MFPVRLWCAVSLGLLSLTALHVTADCSMPSVRPPTSQRTFAIPEVESYLTSMVAKFKDPNLGKLFANTLPNTLDTTVHRIDTTTNAEDAFIVTGDITAMWIRDSSNQVAPFIEFAKQGSAQATALLRGVIRRQASSINIDSYANAFQIPEESSDSPHVSSDSSSYPGFLGSRLDAYANPNIFERKYELDSLANFLYLSTRYYNETKDVDVFSAHEWLEAVSTVLDTLTLEQRSSAQEDAAGGPTYTFQRQTSQPTDSLSHGRGWPAAPTGMIKTGFRPSDDAHVFPYLVPANCLAVVALRGVAGILDAIHQSSMAATARSLASAIDAGIKKFGIISDPVYGSIYAYEVDGYGNHLFMDDGNVPSLLSLPYIGYLDASDPTYINTRRAILSSRNPYYFSGSAFDGVGSPHTGQGRVWPMGIVVRAITSSNVTEISHCLDMLIASSDCTGVMHESVDENDAGSFTRPWFAWANEIFAQLIVKIAAEHPSLIFAS